MTDLMPSLKHDELHTSIHAQDAVRAAEHIHITFEAMSIA